MNRTHSPAAENSPPTEGRPPSEHLTETLADWRGEATVDNASRSISNVALAGRVSKNGYRYSEESLRNAARLYEGTPVFLDHGRSPRQRSTRDLAGRIENARYEDGRIRGDIFVLETEAGTTLLALAAGDAPSVGMSHVVLARRTADGKLIEAIEEVVSVDAVVFPATTDSLSESQLPNDIASKLLAEMQSLRAELAVFDRLESLLTKSNVPAKARPTSYERREPQRENDARLIAAIKRAA